MLGSSGTARVLEGGDLRLPALLALLERRADVIARRAQVRDILDHLRQLLPVRRELHLRVAKALNLLALLRLLRLLRLRRVLAELLVLRKEILVRLLRRLLGLDQLGAGLAVPVEQVMEHLHGRRARAGPARVLRERGLLVLHFRLQLNEAVLAGEGR